MKTFPTEKAAFNFFRETRWKHGVVCPRCGLVDKNYVHQSKPNGCYKYRCKPCKHIFSDTSGTVFHRSRISLQLWFFALHEFFQQKDITSVDLAHKLGIRQQKAWKMLSLLKNNLQDLESLFIDEIMQNADSTEQETVVEQKCFIESSVVNITEEKMVFTPTLDESNSDEILENAQSKKPSKMEDAPVNSLPKKKMKKA